MTDTQTLTDDGGAEFASTDARHAAAADALFAAKQACDDGCADEAAHADHRAPLEAAYAEFAEASRAHVAAQNQRLALDLARSS